MEINYLGYDFCTRILLQPQDPTLDQLPTDVKCVHNNFLLNILGITVQEVFCRIFVPYHKMVEFVEKALKRNNVLQYFETCNISKYRTT